MLFNSGDLPTSRLKKALELLALSAQSGYIAARASFSRLNSGFGYPSPVDRRVEIEWLQEATEAGSVTAQRRLRDLDPKGFSKTMQEMRRRFGYICPRVNEILFQQCQHAKNFGGIAGAFFARLYESALTGDVQVILRIPEYAKGVYNYPNDFGETPLLIACREGHAAVAELLLARGADASHANRDGVTSLHFLAAFDDEHIPRMASLLLQHGADLESVCEQSSIYKDLPDSLFGHCGGTPLLWAVAARSNCAVWVLMDKGADPFRAPTPSGLDGPQSAIAWAAMFHQDNLLEIMLSKAQDGRLCSILQQASQGDLSREVAGAFYMAVDCNISLRFREYLIHGKSLEAAALQCVQILDNFKIGPTMFTRRNGLSDHPIMAACISGNMRTVIYLWNYRNGILRPTPEMWSGILKHVIFEGNHTVFDFLIQHRGDIATDLENDVRAIRHSLMLTNDRHIVLGILKLVLQPSAAYRPSHHGDIFTTALLAEHFEAANLIFQKGHVNLTSRIKGRTRLGGLISNSFHHPNMDRKVSFIIGLTCDAKDELFWNVTYLQGRGLTALQAVVSAPPSTAPLGAGVFEAIVEHYSEPKYLNAQVKHAPREEFSGYSALHMAAEYGNNAAVTGLLRLRKAGLNKDWP
ncbi:hypothetical protein VTI28DRAFT_7821 [Corynascus sepedonium]